MILEAMTMTTMTNFEKVTMLKLVLEDAISGTRVRSPMLEVMGVEMGARRTETRSVV